MEGPCSTGGDCSGIPQQLPKTPKPKTKLTPKGGKITSLYELAKAKYGANLKLEDFIAMMLSREFMGVDFTLSGIAYSARGDPLEVLRHAMTHAAWLNCNGNNGGNPCSSLDINAMFNFIGAYTGMEVGSTAFIYNEIMSGGSFEDTSIIPEITPATQGVAEALAGINIEPEWTISEPLSVDHLVYYGNASMYPGLTEQDLTVIQYLANEGYPVLWWYGGGDTAFIFTRRQMDLLAPYKR
jgi:hypothetical protein